MSTQTTPMNAQPRADEAYVLGLLDGWIVVFRGEDYRQPSEDVARGVADALNSIQTCDEDHREIADEARREGYAEALHDARCALESLP